MYTYVDAALVRAATAGDLALPPWPDLTETTEEHAERWRGWLRQVWANGQVVEAIEVASPSLAHRVRHILDRPGGCSPRRMHRAVTSVIGYLLRMTSRATPFGLFAGAAPARFGEVPPARWTGGFHAVVGADESWLDGLITRLESCPGLLDRLPVTANNLSTVRDDRLFVPFQQQSTEVSLRHTSAVRSALRWTRAPIRFADVVTALATEFPGTPVPVINRMVGELVTRRVLLTSLRPPMTTAGALEHVVEQLTIARADTVPEAVPLVREIERVRDELKRHNRTPLAEESRDIRRRADLVVNLRARGQLTLPQQVAQEAEAATRALTRLTPYPEGSPPWRDYHDRFLERYGIGALVPVTELVNSDIGLGFPAGYRGSPFGAPSTSLTKRDQWLMAQAQRAALAGGAEAEEVELDDRTIRDLTAGQPSMRTPPHVELRFHLEADNGEALGRGDFRLVVASVSRAAGTTAGRFLNLLDPADRDRMAREYAALPTANDAALRAQISSPPLRPRTTNVARAPAVLPLVLSLGEHRATDEALLQLDDLAVTADARNFSLISISRRRTVEPTILNAVEFRHHTHPVARFLCEITTALSAAVLPFSWGAAAGLPYLPRIRYRRAVLAPARWNLPASELPDGGAAWPVWLEQMTAWRHRHHLPATVSLVESDRHLHLDLHESAHLALLRSRMNRTGQVTLYEAPAPDAYGWFDGRAHEISVPLASTASPAPQPVPTRATITRSHGDFPGSSDLLYVKLFGHPGHQNRILTSHIRRLLSAWDEPPIWWYVRYRRPEHHLRLRFRLGTVGAYGPALRHLGSWATDLKRRGLINRMQVDTHFPEYGRYGTGSAMTAAEAVFAADSAAAITQLAHAADNGEHPYAVTAASFIDLATVFTGSAETGTRWLIDNIRRSPRPSPPPCTDDLGPAWTARTAALTSYRTRISTPDAPNPDRVLAALLHLHHIRMNGVDEDAEQTCLHLARTTALSWAAQTAGAAT